MWNQGLFFDVNWQPKFNVVSTLFLGRCINVAELTLFQRGIRVDFLSTSFSDVVTTSCNPRQNDLHFQHFYNVVSTLCRRLFAHWAVPHGHDIKLYSFKTNVALKFAIILQNLITANHTKNGKTI